MPKSYSKTLLFIAFWVAALIIYYPTAGAGFVTDVIGWFKAYAQYGIGGLTNAFGDRSLHYIYHLFAFTLYRLFGWNGIAWYLVFTGLHAVAAILAWRVFASFLKKLEAEEANSMAFAGAVLFLISPYQTESLVWYACIHYLVATILMLLALRAFLIFYETGKTRAVILFYLFFTAAVFTLEISFCLPLFIGACILFLPPEKATKLKALFLFVLPSIGLVGFYFLLNKLLRGNAAGHYGAAVHFNFSPSLLVANFSKYLFKLLALGQFLNHDRRMLVYSFFETTVWAYSFIVAAFATALFFILRFKEISRAWQGVVLMLLGFAFAMAPVVNLYFTDIVRVEGDRFTYYASIYLYLSLVLALFQVFRKAASPIIGLYALLNFYCLQKNINAWHNNREVSQSLQDSFKWQNAHHVFILNLPDNYDGTYMYRNMPPDNRFAETLDQKRGGDLRKRCDLLLGYNMQTPFDSVKVEVLDSESLKMRLGQWGNWWWQNGIGASSYQTESYSVAIDEWGGVVIHFKQKIPGAVYLYQCGKQWRRVQAF